MIVTVLVGQAIAWLVSASPTASAANILFIFVSLV